MKKLTSLGTILAYVALVAIGVPILGPVYGPIFVPFFLAALSALFVWLYVAVIGGRLLVSLYTVIFATLLFPLATLMAIGWPAHQSWSAIAEAFAFAFQAASPIWGLEVLLPLAAASIAAVFIHSRRSNKALNTDAAR